MPLISKQWFYDRVGPEDRCRHIIHPWTDSCLDVNFLALRTVIIGATKFYIPIYLAQAILDHKKISKQYVYKSVINIARSVLYAICLGVPVVALNCIFSHAFGIHYYNVGFLVGILSGLALLVESNRHKKLDTLIFFNMVIESMLSNLDYFNIIKLTKRNQTLLFMISSSYLMYLLKNRKENFNFVHFWFYMPDKNSMMKCEDEKFPNKLCAHPNTCTQFSLENFSKYFVIGYGINIMKGFLSRFGKLVSKPSELFTILVNVNNIKFGLFTGCYVTIFGYVSCYLLKSFKEEKPVVPAIAGLLAGMTYRIKPNIQFLIISIVTILQILGENIKKRLELSEKVPYNQIVFMLSNGVLLHNYLALSDTCPKFYKNLLTICSGGLMDFVYKSMVDELNSRVIKKH